MNATEIMIAANAIVQPFLVETVARISLPRRLADWNDIPAGLVELTYSEVKKLNRYFEGDCFGKRVKYYVSIDRKTQKGKIGLNFSLLKMVVDNVVNYKPQELFVFFQEVVDDTDYNTRRYNRDLFGAMLRDHCLLQQKKLVNSYLVSQGISQVQKHSQEDTAKNGGIINVEGDDFLFSSNIIPQ